MLELILENNFKKDIKKLKKAGSYNFTEFDKVLNLLLEENPLPQKYKNHRLLGNRKDYFDCHIKDNWVLIYKIDKNNNSLILVSPPNLNDTNSTGKN